MQRFGNMVEELLRISFVCLQRILAAAMQPKLNEMLIAVGLLWWSQGAGWLTGLNNFGW